MLESTLVEDWEGMTGVLERGLPSELLLELALALVSVLRPVTTTTTTRPDSLGWVPEPARV